jgi:hypothetical protein
MNTMEDLSKWAMTEDLTQAELKQAIKNMKDDDRIMEDRR